MKKKVLSLLLTLAMIVSMMPAMTLTAYATDTNVNWGYLKTAMSGGSQTTVDGVIEVSEDTPESGTRTIKLLTDISAGADDSSLVVPSGKKIVLDLNGHMLDRGLTVSGLTNNDHGSVIEVNGGELTVKDSTPTTPHVGYVASDMVWHLGTGTSSVTPKKIKGGIITGGTGTASGDPKIYFGGGLFINNGGIVTIERGTIAGNEADHAGGIYIAENSKLLILDGSVINNYAFNYNGYGGGIENCGECILCGATIADNYSKKYGGGLYNIGSLILEKATITGNKAVSCGGAIYNFYNNVANPDAQIVVSGDAVISIKCNSCQSNNADNIATDRTILINTALTNAEMHATFITLNIYDQDVTTEGQLTTGYGDKNPDAVLDDFIHYDGSAGYYMALESNELWVKAVTDGKYSVLIPSFPNGRVASDKQIAASGEAVTLTVIPDTGCKCVDGSITVTKNGQTNIPVTKSNDSTYTFTMPDNYVEIGAKFRIITNWQKLEEAFSGVSTQGAPSVFSVVAAADGTRTITLLSDISANSYDLGLEVPAGDKVVLDLKGHTLNRNLEAKTDNGYVIGVKGKLTITDSVGDGRITGGYHKSTGGGVCVESTGELVMSGGKITGNKNTGVNVNGGTFIMSGNSEISYNEGGNAGGVNISGATPIFTMSGNSKISHNTATSNVGGVYAWSGTFKMTSGSIDNNTGTYAGGVFANVNVTIGGTAKITDNLKAGTPNTPNNVCLYTGKYITVGDGTDAPASGMKVGVNTFNLQQAGTSKQFTPNGNGTANDTQYFFSDNADCYVNFNSENNYLELKRPASGSYAINIIPSEHGSVSASAQEASENASITLTVTPDNGYELSANSLKVTLADGTIIPVSADSGNTYTFSMPAAAVSVTATFIHTETPPTPPQPTPEPTPTPDPKPEPKNNDEIIKFKLSTVKSSSNKAIKISWGEIEGATKYVVYGNKCGKDEKKLKTTNKTSYTFKKLNGKKLVAHKQYKLKIVAYTDDSKILSYTIHTILGNTRGKYANVKSIKPKYDELLLSVGVTQKLGATLKMYSGKKHIKKNHGEPLRYISNNVDVATVSSNGIVKAVGKGTATIYIQDIGGKYCKTKVTVE